MVTETHIVIKREDVEKYLFYKQRHALQEALKTIEEGRKTDGKNPVNHYYIVNTDEPYADQVLDVIMRNEDGSVNLRDIKMAVFDFDGTLAIHLDSDYMKHRNDEEYVTKAFQHPNTFYDEIEACSPSDAMADIMRYCRQFGIPMYCVSVMRYSIHADAKRAFISKHYGDDIQFFCADTQESRGDTIEILRRMNKCSLRDVLVIDDIEMNILYLKQRGFSVLDAKEVDYSYRNQTLSDILSLTGEVK